MFACLNGAFSMMEIISHRDDRGSNIYKFRIYKEKNTDFHLC